MAKRKRLTLTQRVEALEKAYARLSHEHHRGNFDAEVMAQSMNRYVLREPPQFYEYQSPATGQLLRIDAALAPRTPWYMRGSEYDRRRK